MGSTLKRIERPRARQDLDSNQAHRPVVKANHLASIPHISASRLGSAWENRVRDVASDWFQSTTVYRTDFYSSRVLGNKKFAGLALAGGVASLGLIGVGELTAWVPLIVAALASLGLFLWLDSD